jgi:hypothetical protein
MAKNPYMSAWLSAANKVVNTARGQAIATGKAQVRRSQRDTISAWLDPWTSPGSKAKGKRSGNRKRTTPSSTGRAKRR